MSYFNRLKADDALWQFATARFTLEFHATEEDCNPADHFSDQRDVEFAQEGGAHWFCAVVIVRDLVGKVIGTDTLGTCSYNTFAEFMTSHRDRDASNRNTLAQKAAKRVICHYFPDMVAQALQDARSTIQTRRAAYAGIKDPSP